MENEKKTVCEGFMCIHEGTDECKENCSACQHNNCKNCESSKEGTC